MAAAKTIVGDFDLPSFEHCVTKQAGIPPDASLGYQVKRRMQDGKTWQSEPLREGLYSVQAHPDAVVGLEREMATWGLQPGWYALNFHPLNQPSKTIWRWEVPVGGAPSTQQNAPVVYQPPSAPQVYQQPPPAPYQYPPHQPQAPQVVQVGPQPYPQHAQTAQPQAFDQYGRPIYGAAQSGYDPRFPSPWGPHDQRFGWNGPLGGQQQPAPPAPPAPAAPDPQIAELRAANAAMVASLTKMEQDRDADRRRQEERDRKQEEKDRDAAAKAREDALVAEIRAVRVDSDAKFERLLARIDADRNAAPKQTVTDQIMGMVTVLAPHFVELRKANAETETAARTREDNLMKLMMERRTDPMVERVLSKWDDLQSAAKGQPLSEQVTMMQTISQVMFGSFSMQMKMLEQWTEQMPQASPLKEIGGQLMEGLKDIVSNYAKMKQSEADRAARAQHTHTATAAPQAQTFDIKTRDGMLGYLRGAGAPDDWCTKPWAMIISSLVKRDDANGVGEALAAQLYSLWKTDSLPEALDALEEVEGFQKPWGLVMSFLPIEKDEATVAYVKSVLDIAEHHYRIARGVDPVEGEAEEEEESEAGGESEEAETTGANGAAHDGVVPAVPATAAA
jgi:hypothetical protein